MSAAPTNRHEFTPDGQRVELPASMGVIAYLDDGGVPTVAIEFNLSWGDRPHVHALGFEATDAKRLVKELSETIARLEAAS